MQPYTDEKLASSCRTDNCEEGRHSAAPSTPTSSSNSTYTASSIHGDTFAGTEERGHSLGPKQDQTTPWTSKPRVGNVSAKVPRRVSPQAVPSNKEDPGTPAITRLLYSCLSWLTGERMPKIPLEKGYSQMDWLRLAQSNKNLNGLAGGRPRDDITMLEVSLHNTKEDAWMVFNGMVYNITPYLRFHPGGSEILMKAAGKDGTSLFMKYHAWVNIGALMGKCLVGRLALSPIQAQAAAEIQQARLGRQQQPDQQEAEASHQAAAPALQIGAEEEARTGVPHAAGVPAAPRELEPKQSQGTSVPGANVLDAALDSSAPPSQEGGSQGPMQSGVGETAAGARPQQNGVAVGLQQNGVVSEGSVHTGAPSAATTEGTQPSAL